MSSISCAKLTIFAIVGVILQTIGLSIFVFGFFPVKPALSGVGGTESFGSPRFDWVRNDSESVENLSPDKLRSIYQELSGIGPSYDQLVFMVIDGLPAEFVLGKDGKPPRRELMEAMPYTQSLLDKGMAIGFHAKAAPPTVTMPRLKAMVSGAVGGFLDVAFNFNTQALLDDNLLSQFFKIGWRMVMLGDETWLKLFPGLFTRHDGVSSFFVKDTVKVDQNVSRHLPQELSRYDWDLLILHYLGLDHVGHIGGRNSILMAPKLTEMDEVIKMIHTSRIVNQMNNHGKTLLVVVSDHGMTENGNHGGSSYEETDSLALFIGLENDVSGFEPSIWSTVHQVDIAPTLALLFGVPIPKNNIGILISENFAHLPDDQKLRALELNSWQLLRLLHAQIPSLSCGSFLYHDSVDKVSGTSDCKGSMDKTVCCLYKNALFLHNSWVSKNLSRFNHGEEFHTAVGAYNEFLKTASEWLSHRVTYKPINLLALGVAAMLLSCLVLLSLLCVVAKEGHYNNKGHCKSENTTSNTWHLDEAFTVAVIVIFVISMGSSSMVEEEQYIWHFVTSTLTLVLLRKATQSLQVGRAHGLFSLFNEQNRKSGFQTISIGLLLISGRILRGWHQGGVNWTDLPDISKWLEHAGSHYIKIIQLVTGLLVISLSLFSLSMSEIDRRFKALLGFFCVTPGLFILRHILKHQDNMFTPSSYNSTTSIQTIYMILGLATVGTAVASSWLSPLLTSNAGLYSNSYKSAPDCNEHDNAHLLELRNNLFAIGWVYICSWCLLQLLLQQPINSMPILLLLIQVFAGMLYSLHGGPYYRKWVEVALFYYMGMAGHYALGNSNSLATIDVAGAFIGISSYSTVLSGILMFIITYASPMLAIISMVMYISVKSSTLNIDSGEFLKAMLAFPCLLPLSLNSILLICYTIVLILMRNHLFIWSVFSPKYLYVCATTVSVYIGVSIVAATVFYSSWVVGFRRTLSGSACRKLINQS